MTMWWWVTFSPTGWEGSYVARRWSAGKGPGREVVASTDLARLGEILTEMGLTKVERHNDDAPAVLERWE